MKTVYWYELRISDLADMSSESKSTLIMAIYRTGTTSFPYEVDSVIRFQSIDLFPVRRAIAETVNNVVPSNAEFKCSDNVTIIELGIAGVVGVVDAVGAVGAVGAAGAVGAVGAVDVFTNSRCPNCASFVPNQMCPRCA